MAVPEFGTQAPFLATQSTWVTASCKCTQVYQKSSRGLEPYCYVQYKTQRKQAGPRGESALTPQDAHLSVGRHLPFSGLTGVVNPDILSTCLRIFANQSLALFSCKPTTELVRKQKDSRFHEICDHLHGS